MDPPRGEVGSSSPRSTLSVRSTLLGEQKGVGPVLLFRCVAMQHKIRAEKRHWSDAERTMMADLFLDRDRVYIETVSLGKGLVNWKVHFPPMAKRHPQVKKEYGDLQEVCRDVKRHLEREQVDPETVALVEQHCTDLEWGGGQ